MTMLTMGNVLGQISKKMESIKLNDNRGCDSVVAEKEKPQRVSVANKKESESGSSDNIILSDDLIFNKEKRSSMIKKGFFKFPRSISNSPFYKEARLKYKHIMNVILENVAFTPTTYFLGCNQLNIDVGQMFISIRELADLCNDGIKYKEDLISKSCVQRAIDYFKEFNLLGQQTIHGKSVITVECLVGYNNRNEFKKQNVGTVDTHKRDRFYLGEMAKGGTVDTPKPPSAIYIYNKNIDKKNIITQPSSSKIDDDDFSSKPKRKERKHVHRDCYLTDEELQECIRFRGSKEIVIKIINQIIDWEDRRYAIKNWAKCIVSWNMKPDNLNKSTVFEENKQKGLMFEKQFNALKKGWQVRNYRDMNKNQEGLLFECVGGVQSNSYFVSYSDSDFNNKIIAFAKEKNLIKAA